MDRDGESGCFSDELDHLNDLVEGPCFHCETSCDLDSLQKELLILRESTSVGLQLDCEESSFDASEDISDPSHRRWTVSFPTVQRDSLSVDPNGETVSLKGEPFEGLLLEICFLHGFIIM